MCCYCLGSLVLPYIGCIQQRLCPSYLLCTFKCMLQAKLEEERRMAEEEARLEEERKRAEEEARLEERRRAEEEARLEEEQRREEEEARLQEERRRVEEEARLEEEHRRAEEEAAECRMAEEEARQEDERGRAVKEARWEEERRMAQARELEEHRRAAEEQAEFEPIPDEESKFRQSEEKERRPSIKDVPSPCRSSQRHLPGEPEVTEDGWSNISPDLNSRQNLIDFLALRCKQVETEMQKKQTEIQNDMNDLLKRHEMMESRLNSSYQPQGQLALALAPMSPESLQHRPSVGRAAHTPSSVYQEKRRHSILVDDRQNWQEQRAFIMEDLQKTSTPSRLSPPSPRTEEKNRCIKTFKKCTQIDGSKSRSPGTPVKDEELQLQRQWWAQQRRALFKETQLSCESEDPRTRAFPARYTRVVQDLVYAPCEKEVPFTPGVVVEVRAEDAVVQVADDLQTIPLGDLRRRFIRDDGATCSDNTSLVHLNDATILENLKARHEVDEIYTYTASVLLAVNPYKDVTGLYGESQCLRYRGKHIGALPPHPYAIADTAYRALVRDRKNQGFIISGESGAGKTETAKIVMEYLGYVSGSCNQKTEQIQRRVEQAQPILESFGNAVTMRNNNSSRFGKYNRVFFDEHGILVDASVTTYLLESSRVVVHARRERTYHCFYEMLRGLPDEKLSQLHLEREKLYLLLASDAQEDLADDQKWHSQFQDRDAKLFHKLCGALSTVGFSGDEIDKIFQVLAGLVHLGDLSNGEKDEGDEAATVQLDQEILNKASALLGMDSDELGGALRRRRVRVTHAGRESLHEVPRTTSQFRHALHSLIKALYKRLFERLVQRINSSFGEWRRLPEEDEKWYQIGILDIYGFERLQRNSFEQLCINLANERLQQYFVEKLQWHSDSLTTSMNVLVAEQDLYKREGLPWIGLELPDSTPVVSAIVQTFKTLDEYSQQLAKGFEKTSDEGFCQKTVEDSQKDVQRKEVLRPLKMSNKRGSKAGTSLAMNEGFVVKHYAGMVEYNTKGWLDKNNDRLLAECEDLICTSSFDFVASLGEADAGKVPFRSISKKYCADLENLLETLNTCHLHYIRCFKPNEFQKPAIFSQTLVLDQLVQCGTIELVKIMHDGYPNRSPFNTIVQRFRDLLPESFQRYGMRTFIEALMLAYEVPEQEWALGMSRLFLKAGQLKALEDMRSEGAEADPERLKAIVHSIIRKKWVRAKNAIQLCLYLPRRRAKPMC
ncbi:unnamed protein product [Durusdinium trenchii]|uniref:Myosin motor domain-containing protein n=1 Tax=Durusdinium trenchii TaxID=1381693 RepID=A0ABP0HUM2_9DINO